MAGQADGVAAASQVVGGSWVRPKGPSPEDDILVEAWKAQGKLHVLEGVWCCVPYKVTVVPGAALGGGEASLAKAKEVLDSVAEQARSIFSHFEKDSEVSAINRLQPGEVREVSPAMRTVLGVAAQLNRLTRGAFDPAVLPLTEHFKDGGTPCQTVAASAKWSNWRLDDKGISKTNFYAKLDLCGLAKGWAIDEMARQLQEAGFESCYVDWGGDIKVVGRHPAGRNWTAAVAEPPPVEAVRKQRRPSRGHLDQEVARKESAGSGQYLVHIELRDGQSIATSGDYQQILAEGLSHVIDPKKGVPVKISGDSCATVSVVCNSCMLADALATSAMAVSGTHIKEGRKLLDTFRTAVMKDPVADYLLYSRAGPRVVRLREAATELKEHLEDRHERHEEAHVVIVGGGLAGISAAIEAAKARARVTLLEKEKDLGGNSAKATSGINACNTRVQKLNGVDDDGRYFERDTHVSAKGGKSDVGCVTTLSEKGAEAIHWLIDELGVPLTALSQLGGHARKRTHRVPPRADGTPLPVGWTIMQHARAAASAFENITVRTGCTLTKILKEPESPDAKTVVCGVEFKDESGNLQTLMCDAVVLTTGGFGYDHGVGSLMAEHRPDLVGVPTTNGAFANGDGIRFGYDVGATLVDMDKVQLHPTAFIDPKDPAAHTKYLGPEALRGSGGILLDQHGKRFINELDLRSVVSAAILKHCDPYMLPDGKAYQPWAWCVLNEESQEKFGRAQLMFYKDQVGLFQAAEGTKGLAELIGCPEEHIVETLKEYAAAVDQTMCQKTGKVVFPSRMCETDKSFIVGRITPCIHYCMGGLEISAVGEVQTVAHGAMGKHTKIRRLFAAGECTGGVHGGNRLGGNSLLECVVFGRLAGERAATIKQKSPTCLDKGEWVPMTLREVRATDVKYGQNTAVYRFNLHGSLQTTGLDVGRFIAIRGELDGDTLTGYYSPVSRPEDEGVIDILCRMDEKGGPIVGLLTSMRPGSSCLMRGMGGPRLVRQPDSTWQHNGRDVRKLSLLCGGTGLAPAVQIARAYINSLMKAGSDVCSQSGGLRIVYAAENTGDLAFVASFDALKARFPQHVQYYLVLNTPPHGWVQGIGFVDNDCIRRNLWFPPADDHLLVMCGPPIFENIMCKNLVSLGYPSQQFYSFAADPEALLG